MIGLREYVRDLALPGRLGEPDLVVPPEEVLLDSVRRVLELPGGPRAERARCTFARWKPGTSITAGFVVGLSNGEEHHVTWKRYRGDKARSIAASFRPDRYASANLDALQPNGVDLEGNAVLYAFPVDRILPGLARVLDMRRTSHQVDRARLFEPWIVRRRASRVHVLRYKPERRAVLRLELKLRDGGEGRARREVIARVLPPRHAARTVAARHAFEAAGDLPIPRLLLAEAHSGILFEEFLTLGAPGEDEFAEVAGAGELLARLHALPAPEDAEPVPGPARSDWLDRVPGLGERARRVPAAVPGRGATWIHGDFHPDQVVRGADGDTVHLLDLDELRVGDPVDDLASWAADEIAFGVAAPSGAGEALLDAYAAAGGRPPTPAVFNARVADALVRRAEAALRRCEAGAIERAEHLVECALELCSKASRGTAPSSVGNHLERVAEALGSESGSVELVRLESVPSGDAVLRVREEGEPVERVFRVDGSRAVEITPEEDDALPVAYLLRSGGEPIDEILAWRPGRRMTLLARSGRVVKGYRARRAERSVRAHEIAFRAARGTLLRVPQVLAFEAETERMDLERIAGTPVSIGPESAETFFRLGHGLREWQEAKPDARLRHHDVRAELEVLRTLAERVAGFFGATPRGYEALYERLAALADGVPEADPTIAHRDLHDGQVLEADGELGLLDFDLLCLADPALDAANLTAHLRLRALQEVRGATESSADAACEALLEGLDRGSEPAFHTRLRFYQAATFLRLSLVYSLRPPWAHVVPPLLDLSSRCLDELRAR